MAAPGQVLVNGSKYHQVSAGCFHLNKNIKIRSVEWFKIIDCSDGSTDGIVFNHSGFDHPVYEFESLLHFWLTGMRASIFGFATPSRREETAAFRLATPSTGGAHATLKNS